MKRNLLFISLLCAIIFSCSILNNHTSTNEEIKSWDECEIVDKSFNNMLQRFYEDLVSCDEIHLVKEENKFLYVRKIRNSKDVTILISLHQGLLFNEVFDKNGVYFSEEIDFNVGLAHQFKEFYVIFNKNSVDDFLEDMTIERTEKKLSIKFRYKLDAKGDFIKTGYHDFDMKFSKDGKKILYKSDC